MKENGEENVYEMAEKDVKRQLVCWCECGFWWGENNEKCDECQKKLSGELYLLFTYQP